MKFNKIFLVIAFFGAMCVNSSCKKTVYNQITEDEIKWIIYLEGEKIIFADSANADTFHVIRRERGYEKDKPYYNEHASAVFYNYSDTVPGNKYGNLRVQKDDNNNFKASYIFPHFPFEVVLTDMIPVPQMIINGLPYTNVYVAEADSLYYSTANYLRKIYYSKEAGFLQLDDIYGGVRYKIN